jgi:hypothetical protein
VIDPCDPGARSPAAPTVLRTIRGDVVAFARELADLGANPADTAARARYLELVAPGETERRAAEMALMSGCELVCRGIWRRFIVHPLLESIYVDQHAGSDLLAIARQAGAATSGLIRWPEPGDVVIVGGSPALGGWEHAWTSLSIAVSPYEHAPDDAVETHQGLDGGQHDGADKQVIHLRQHELHGGWDSTATYRRKVQWVLDVEAIIRAFGR